MPVKTSGPAPVPGQHSGPRPDGLHASGAPLFRGLYPVAAGTAPAERAVPSQPSGFLARQPSKLGTQESQTWAHATCNSRSRS